MKSQFDRLRGAFVGQLNAVKSLVQGLGGDSAAEATRQLDQTIALLDQLALAVQRYRSASGRANFDQVAQQQPVRAVAERLYELNSMASYSVVCVAKEASALLPFCETQAERDSLTASLKLAGNIAEMMPVLLQMVLAASFQSGALAVQPVDIAKLRSRLPSPVGRTDDRLPFFALRPSHPGSQGIADW